MEQTEFTLDSLKKHLNPWQVSILAGAGIGIAQFFSLAQMWAGAVSFGGTVLTTAILFVIIDTLVDVIANLDQLRKDRKFRINWAKNKYQSLMQQTGKTFVFALAISLASLFLPQIATVLLTVAACAVFTMGAQCVEGIFRQRGLTPENSKVLRAFTDASYVMVPVLGYLQATITRVAGAVINGVRSAFNWARNAVVYCAGKAFESAQAFTTFLLKEGARRFFRNDGNDPGPFKMVNA